MKIKKYGVVLFLIIAIIGFSMSSVSAGLISATHINGNLNQIASNDEIPK
jgi:hypothetical protein